ncbi:MAG: hypothetical protein HY898_01000 [Deltaproteobacteria bacterium]|nr:hypothetical protein [Deltaproteobacteria bacterium]
MGNALRLLCACSLVLLGLSGCSNAGDEDLFAGSGGGTSDAGSETLDPEDTGGGDGPSPTDDTGTTETGVPGECTPGAKDARPCGNCGTQARGCGAEGTWSPWAACGGEGQCAPGATESVACGAGGTQTRTCSPTCQWNPYGACVGATDCPPGSSDSQPCGNCGTHSRTCSSSGTWEPFGPCSNEGVCAAGEKQTQPCKVVGTQSATCSSSCAWGAWGPCAGANPPPSDGGSGTFVFPKTADVSKPALDDWSGFSMTDIGSYVIGARTTTLASATSFASTIQYNNYLANSSTCTVHFDIYLNGVKIGSSGAGNAQQSSSVSLTFPAIPGPVYEILYLTTASPTQSGCGALYLEEDVSSVTLK